MSEHGERAPSFDELLHHQAWLTALARQLTHDPHAAQDLVQETWLAAIRSGPIAKPRGFLVAVMRRLAQRRVRDESYHDHEAFDDEVERDQPTQAPAEEAARLSVRRRIVDCVMEMRDPDRNLLLHHYYYSRDFDELARLFGLPRERVTKRLFAARERLRRVLVREKIGGASLYSCLGLFLEGPARSGALRPAAPSPLRLASVGGVALVVVATGAFVSQAVLRSDEVAGVDGPPRAHAAASATALPSKNPPFGADQARRPLPDVPRLNADTPGGAVESRSATREVALVGTVSVLAEDQSLSAPGIPIEIGVEVFDVRGRLDAAGCGALLARFDAVAGPDGSFRIERVLPDETLRLHARVRTDSESFAPWPANAVTLAPGDAAAALELWLLPLTRDVHGVILDPGGNPLVGATVTSVGRERATTDATGAFTIATVGWQEDAITVRADGYVTEVIPCAPGLAALEPVQLAHERPVSVLVRTPSGQPLAEVRVGALGHDASFLTDAEGRATIHGIGAREVGLVFEDDDRPRYERSLAPEESELDVRLPEGVTLSGTVRDEHGAPLPGARVTAVTRATDGGTFSTLTFSDSEGHYQLLDLAPGLADVTFGGARGERSERLIDVGDRALVEDLVLGTPLLVVRQVFHEDGTPATGARVTPVPAGPDTGSVFVDAGGTFALELAKSASGVTLVLAEHVPRHIAREELFATEPLVLLPAGRFRVRLAAKGEAPQGVRIRAVDASGATTKLLAETLYPWTEEPFVLDTSAAAVGQRATFELTADGYAPVVFTLEALAGEEPRPRTVVLGAR